jgi:hypothetical protein
MKIMVANKKCLYKSVAIGLIVLSFLLYFLIPFNICLPYSVCVIAGITGAMMLVSEIIFWIGSMMLGRDVIKTLRKKFSMKK